MNPVPFRSPEVVVTLPGRSAEALRQELARAHSAGADLVEIRVDRLPTSEVPRLTRLHEIPLRHEWLPAILTVRSRAEGGEGPEDRGERRDLVLRALEALPFSYVDLELERDLGMQEELRSWDGPPLRFVVSAHLSAGTPGKRARATLDRALARGDVGKVVLPASLSTAVDEIIPCLEGLSGRPWVLHTTGPSGALLRILAGRLGMHWVYASLPMPGSLREPVPSAGSVEPSQVPVDRLRRFFAGGDGAAWYAVLGRPIGHSLSPDLHQRFLEARKRPGIMIPLEPRDETEMVETLPKLTPWGLKGANVTRPYKECAARMAMEASEEVRRTRAANTLVPDPSHAFRAYNTDVGALRRIFRELVAARRWRGDQLLVVGSGGAARAALAAGIEEGSHVSFTARRRESARELLALFAPHPVGWMDPDSLTPSPLVVHATPVGRVEGEDLPFPLEKALGPGSVLLDLVYHPVTSVLKEMARRAGASYLDGLRMLIYQAVESFRHFTGEDIPRAVVENLLDEAGVAP